MCGQLMPLCLKCLGKVVVGAELDLDSGSQFGRMGTADLLVLLLGLVP
jgi:hypothetical protein